MAVKHVGGTPESFALEAPVTAGVAIAEGDILAINGNVLERATSSSTIHTIVGYAAETISTAATLIKYRLFLPGQIFEVDATNNTAANQLYESCALTDHSAVSNTSSDVTGPTGVFLPVALKGAAADKKMLGEFTRLQSTST